MTVSNATRTSFEAITAYPQSYILINNTLPEMANQNLSFTADGKTFANSKVDSKGFVSFNYSGTWSNHKFEWILQSDGNVNLSDLIMIATHIGEVTSAPYPSYDPNADGIVSIFDAVLVAKKIL